MFGCWIVYQTFLNQEANVYGCKGPLPIKERRVSIFMGQMANNLLDAVGQFLILWPFKDTSDTWSKIRAKVVKNQHLNVAFPNKRQAHIFDNLLLIEI